MVISGAPPANSPRIWARWANGFPPGPVPSGAAAIGAGLGLALGAATGDGHTATAGAVAGGAVGATIGAGMSDQANYSIQRRYDIAYAQCMYSKGNQVPGFARPRAVSPPPPPGRNGPPPPPGRG